jgi:integrase/recombinase XerD
MSIDLSRVRICGPLTPFVAGFAEHLTKLGYTQMSVPHQMRLMAHLSQWLASESLGVDELVEAELDRFMQVRLAAGRTRLCSIKALGPILTYLRSLGVAPALVAITPDGPVDELLQRYEAYLTVERGLGAASARAYVAKVRPFLQGRLPLGEHVLDLAHLSAADVVNFVAACCPGQGHYTASLTVCGLRSLLGFLYVEGITERSLAGYVPSVASRRLAGLPKWLDANQVQCLLESCDRKIPCGCRDFAVLTLLVRLGLRAGEVARLALDDIDWRAGEIIVHGKGSCERLPLPTDVGEAVATYLRYRRPKTAQGRTAFVRIKAPHRALTGGGVTQIVAAAGRRAGLGTLHAHRLRHTAASAMLRAGASLPEIGQLLRHRKLLTTAIYAKIDREALRKIARPWPGDIA